MSDRPRTSHGLTALARWRMIHQWWEGIVHGCDFATTQRRGRIFSAFRHVLMAVPERDFWMFVDQNPLLIFKGGHMDGTLFRLAVPLTGECDDNEDMDDESPDFDADYPHQVAIYLNPRILDEDQPYVAHVVAHEIGHLVLRTEARESRVDRYAARLGFPPPSETTAAGG
jgi:hypothetical protein